ncbi:hypothetical protein B0H14DRAFT_3745869 [Mycena olivaceomarginata]|nr:hypothetical protein B0H14DRAFT_3745869 [Mycena olivaceomarginata]
MSVNPAVGGAAAPPPPYVHRWNAPGITSLPHLWLSNRLQFNPLGLFDLRRHIGIFHQNPSIWNIYGHRFLSSDIAWFAAGKNSDGAAARKGLIQHARSLMFDLGMLVDPAAGSTTMIMHVDGATMPNTPARPEFLKGLRLCTTSLSSSQPRCAHSHRKNCPMFLESVGVPTVTNFLADGEAHGWNFTQHGPVRTPNHIAPGLVIPQPTTTASAHYVFRGRPHGSLDVVAPPVAPTTPPRPSYLANIDSLWFRGATADAANLLDAIEENAHLMQRVVALENELAQAQADLGDFQMQADYLSQQNSDLYAREQEHEQHKHELHGIIGSLQIQPLPLKVLLIPPHRPGEPRSFRGQLLLYTGPPRAHQSRPDPSHRPPFCHRLRRRLRTLNDERAPALWHTGDDAICACDPARHGPDKLVRRALTALDMEEDGKDFLLDAMAADMAYD